MRVFISAFDFVGKREDLGGAVALCYVGSMTTICPNMVVGCTPQK